MVVVIVDASPRNVQICHVQQPANTATNTTQLPITAATVDASKNTKQHAPP